MCIYFVFAVLDYNPISLVFDSWRDPYSPLQYLVYVVITMRIVESRTLDIGYSTTLSVISAAAAGYLYEVPRWLQWGIWDLFRTAKTSVIIIDWGMLCVPLMILLSMKHKPQLFDTKFLLSLCFYEIYCIAYYYNSTQLIQLTNMIFHPLISKTIIFRIPAMLLCGFYLNTLKKD
jgi:hypothetical protein